MSFKFLSLLTPMLCMSCGPSEQSTALQGSWLSNGYGIGARISGQWVESYSVANNTCLSDSRDHLFGLLAAFDIAVAEDGQSFLLSFQGTEQTIRFDRITDLPTHCDAEPDPTPLGTFDAFADIFATHYAFFDVYGVNWSAAVAQARRNITPQTTDAELFAILSGLLAPLRDGHIGLMGEVDGAEVVFEPNPGDLFARIQAAARAGGQPVEAAEDAFREAYWKTHISNEVLQGQGTFVGSEFIQYGLLAPQTGYINFLTMAYYATGDIGEPLKDLEAIHEVMDEIISAFEAAGVDHVIIDLSLNFGGFDDIGLAIASRFAQEPVFVLSEYPADAPDRIEQRRNVTPSDKSRYTGDLTLVTSNMTVSAGEIFTMALRALPQTTHVGAPTRGALSDVLDKQLPNGWVVELSNEVYSDHEGQEWEGRGIPPSQRFPVFTGDNPLMTHAALIRQIVEGQR
ncbi:S41 family peptidase [Yoonia sp. GPGPB17]|uniref:S41 family peptidase n=1 Tax=Yoonia sp. GPGPB17 TaxID=3026147 RepID=UPI0030BFE224